MGKTAICALVLALWGGQAMAADDPLVISADSVNPERFGWTGAYVGVSAGYAWLRDVDYAFVPPARASGEDWNVGLHAGYLHQFGRWVIGAEVEATNLNIQFDGLPVWVGEGYGVKARAGFAMDRFLFTGHLGGTWINTRSAIPLYHGLADWALTYGAGVDYAFTDNFTVGVNYSHMTSDRYDGTLIYADIDTVTLRAGYKF